MGSSSASFGTGPGFDVARLDSNGLPDTTFGSGGSATFAIDQAGGAAADSATGVAIESTGDIVVVGTSPTSAGNAMTVLQLTSAGTLDPSFGSGGVVTISFSGPSTASGVAVTSNGEILVAGLAQVPVGGQTQLEFAVALLKTSGQLDTSFGNGGMTTVSSFTASGNSPAIALQANGSILLAGNRVDHAIAVARLTSNGMLDSKFGTGGVQFLPNSGGFSTFGVAAVAVQPNAGIVIAGGPDDTGGPDGFDVARLSASGRSTSRSTTPVNCRSRLLTRLLASSLKALRPSWCNPTVTSSWPARSAIRASILKWLESIRTAPLIQHSAPRACR